MIRNASDGKKYLYDIVNIKEDTASAFNLLNKEIRVGNSKAATQGDVSINSIRITQKNVKENIDEKQSTRKKQDVSEKGLSYASLVALPDLTGTVLNKNQQVKMTPDGKIDDTWLRKEVIGQCNSVDRPGTLPAHYLYSDALGENVEITKDAIQHGYQKSIGKNARNPVPREILNAKATLNLHDLLKTAIVVNLSDKHKNYDSPFAYVMMAVMGMKTHNGKTEYYAVRLVVQKRINGNPILREAEVLNRLSAINAKKIDLPHPRVGGAVALRHSGQFDYSIANLLHDVKDIFPDTFSEDVYKRLGTKREENEHFSKYLLYQTRKSGTSARSLLANALESVAQNDIERNKLLKFKEKMELLNEEEKKLRELNEQIHQLAFPKKGSKKDQQKINELRLEANKTLNRINILDKSLFSLEASAPLKAVLQREKDAARKKCEKEGRERTKQKVKEKTESISKKHAKKELERLVLETTAWITKPKKGEVPCPDIIKEPLADFLAGIDTSSKKLLTKGVATQRDLKFAIAMDSLATAVEKIKNSQDPSKENSKGTIIDGYLDLPPDFVENIRAQAEAIKNYIKLASEGDSIINDMSADELKELSRIIKMLKKSIKEMQRLYTNYRFANAVALGKATVGYLNSLGAAKEESKFKDFAVWDNTVPYYAFKRFGELEGSGVETL